MGRRRSESLAQVFLQLPWWVGLMVAAVVYFLFTIVAPALVPQPNLYAPMLAEASRQWGRILAGILVLLSIGSAIRAFLSRRLLDAQSSIDSIRSLSWRQFEVLVAEAFRRRGYTVLQNGGGGADGGVDVVLLKNGQRFFVQCKQWKARQIGVTTVRELKGVIATSGAAGGFVVSSGSFTPDARAFASNANIELIDGPALLEMVEEVKSSAGPSGAPKSHALQAAPIVSAAIANPTCPKCGSSMTKRTARRGPNAGGEFWGCSSFPKCRGAVGM
jgi:restriction system protein